LNRFYNLEQLSVIIGFEFAKIEAAEAERPAEYN
jgi:hypothetical protein